MGRRWGRWAAVILPAIVIGGLSWCGWRWWDVRRYRDAMAQIERAMQDGRYAVAARDLSALLARRPDSDRAAYLLGVCEKARGRMPEADAVWARIPPDSPSDGRAVAARMDLLVEQGRLAEAEKLIETAAEARGAEGSALRSPDHPDLHPGRPGDRGRAADRVAVAEPGGQGRRGVGAGHQPGATPHGAALERPARGLGPCLPRPSRPAGCRRRPDLAGASEPRDPDRLLRRGEAVDRRLPPAPPR